ncbi:MAG: dihydropteroate synthase [Thermoplasmata archaeon]
MPDPPPTGHRFGARVLEWETLAQVARELEATESDPEGVGIMTRKGRVFPVRLDGVPLKAAPILKQEMLSVGGDAAHARGVADHSVAATPVVLLGTWGQYRYFLPKLRRQPFGLPALAEEVDRALRAFTFVGPRTVPGAHRSLPLGERTSVLGVVNVTPDSFSDGGHYLDPAAAAARADEMVAEGAAMIDLGAESTRPGAAPVTPEAEWGRLGPVLSRLSGRLAVPISVDTRHAEVAARAIDAGADVVNDVEGLRAPEMRRVVARSGAAAIVMHMRGEPRTMQQQLAYADVRGEVFRALAEATDRARADGIPAERLLIDPGLGFGKSAPQSLELLVHLGELRSLGYPIVVGASRKSFLAWAIEDDRLPERLEAGLAAAVLAADRGASIVRTHDVGPTVRALRLADRARRLRAVPPATPEGAAAGSSDP